MGFIGVAINDSIVVVAAISANPKAVAGDVSEVIKTVLEVTRHVLATTATTVVGFVPLVLAGGGFWPPLAVSIGAGVLGATLIAMTLVPCTMLLFARPGPRDSPVYGPWGRPAMAYWTFTDAILSGRPLEGYG
ncbi:MAG: efflux RND transporter permease subunit, partial [Pirellulaceae bacterium]